MKKLMMGMSILAYATSFALDNTIDNGFWNTKAYVNATPVTSVATVTFKALRAWEIAPTNPY